MAGGFNTITSWVEHVPGSPEESFEPGRSQAVRVYDVLWDERIAFARALLGRSRVRQVAGGNQLYISRDIPHAHPGAVAPDGSFYLYATRIIKTQGIGFVGVNGAGQDSIAKYQKARLSVMYSTLDWRVISDQSLTNENSVFAPNPVNYPSEANLKRYVSVVVSPSVKINTISGDFFKQVPFGSGPGSFPVKYGLNKQIPDVVFEVTWHEVPLEAVPLRIINRSSVYDEMSMAMGTVNYYPFAGCRKGTLLYTGARLKPYMNAWGERIYDITYIFKYLDPEQNGLLTGHQHIFLPKPPGVAPADAVSWGWTEVTADGVTNLVAGLPGKSIFDWTDFVGLFGQPVF